MEIYKVDGDITNDLVLSLVDRHMSNVKPKIERLRRYYLGQSDIKERTMKDVSKPNNKVANPFAAYITDTIQGYFLGKPISYTSDDEQLLEKLQYIWDDNHENAHNSKISKELSISGIAYELIYIDELSNIRFTVLDSSETFMIYDTSVEQRPIAAIRYYSNIDYVTNESVTFVDVYTDREIISYYMQEDKLRLLEKNSHLFGEVPVICYMNNDEATGDFEKVVDLIDAYDLAVSDTANNLEYFADSYLVLENAGLELEQVPEMKEKRVLLLEGDGKAYWLTKNPNIEESEAYKTRLKEDIHNFSFVPNLNDDSFGSATSGEGLKYKLFGLENAVSTKERMFSEGIEIRNRVIVNILNIKGGSHNHTDVVAQFTRNLPSNNLEISDLVVKLQGILPNETLIGLLPFIDDSDYQIELMKKEKEGTLYEDVLAPE